MIILTIKTDQPEAELALYQSGKLLERLPWQAHRQLAETIHTTMKQLLNKHGYDFRSIEGIVLFKGPGSFTGSRIGASVANALASSMEIPIVGEMGEHWAQDGIKALWAGTTDDIVVPEYGAPARTTVQKK